LKASPKQQTDLLLLAEADREIARTKRAIEAGQDPNHTQELRDAQREIASQLIDARGELDSVALDTQRAQQDLDLVESRVKKDQAQLNSTSSPKDAQGIQSELETLRRRGSELEDLQLELMERAEAAQSKCDEILARKNDIDAKLEKVVSEIESEQVKLNSGLSLLLAKRLQQIDQLGTELSDFYEKKAKRGIAVARLLGRECGACHMTIGATALAEISSLAADELAFCSECQAILVR
jgi:predicted  nucleic acid-binding Zn-ribbon protein